MDKENVMNVYVYIYAMGYYAVMRRKKILPLEMTCMDLEGITLSEMSDIERQTLHDTVYK